MNWKLVRERDCMDGRIIGFVLWAIVGCILIGIGISSYFSKKAVGFWANIKTFPIKDIKGYNHAMCKLFISYGVVFIVLGIPMICDQNTPYILLSVVGVMIETIVMMSIYNVFIEKKYRG